MYLQNINTKKILKYNNIKNAIIRANKAVIFDLGVFGACILLCKEWQKNLDIFICKGTANDVN
jgi:hypothetical protein